MTSNENSRPGWRTRSSSENWEKFNEALGNALTLHREFWTKDDASAVDPRGYVALGLLALACTARNSGMPVDVSSEYLPAVLLEGGRVGERTF